PSTARRRTASTFRSRHWLPVGLRLELFGMISSLTICSARSLALHTLGRARSGSGRRFAWSMFFSTACRPNARGAERALNRFLIFRAPLVPVRRNRGSQASLRRRRRRCDYLYLTVLQHDWLQRAAAGRFDQRGDVAVRFGPVQSEVRLDCRSAE